MNQQYILRAAPSVDGKADFEQVQYVRFVEIKESLSLKEFGTLDELAGRCYDAARNGGFCGIGYEAPFNTYIHKGSIYNLFDLQRPDQREFQKSLETAKDNQSGISMIL